jgi:hypothetical protein
MMLETHFWVHLKIYSYKKQKSKIVKLTFVFKTFT